MRRGPQTGRTALYTKLVSVLLLLHRLLQVCEGGDEGQRDQPDHAPRRLSDVDHALDLAGLCAHRRLRAREEGAHWGGAVAQAEAAWRG